MRQKKEDHKIEEYLKENREATGKNKEYIPLEREADKWEKNQ